MSSYQINPPVHVGECATCGHVQEREICEDCEAKEEARKAPYLAFWAALAVDAELQKSFDVETECFDSGHTVTYIGGTYRLANPEGETLRTFVDSNEWLPISEVITWCQANREVLI